MVVVVGFSETLIGNNTNTQLHLSLDLRCGCKSSRTTGHVTTHVVVVAVVVLVVVVVDHEQLCLNYIH